jgi:hypothetical protein
MCDVLMLSFWVWAVLFWVEGLDFESAWRLIVAGGLIALAELTKYYGLCLVPLLATYSALRKRRFDKNMLFLLIPVLLLAAYHSATRAAYGQSLLSSAIEYTKYPKEFTAFLSLKVGSFLTATTFAGGCLAPVVFFAPLLWRRRVLALFAVVAVGWTIASSMGGIILKNNGPIEGTTQLALELQVMFWTFAGFGVVWLALADLWKNRSSDSWLLGVWALGTFLFAAFINWTVNGRAILPMAPAIAILMVRRMGAAGPAGATLCRLKAIWPLALSGGLALLVARADLLFARAARESARKTFAAYGSGSQRFWFQGHWGFQYYMEAMGAEVLDEGVSTLKFGDIVAESVNNTDYRALNPEVTVLRELVTATGPDFLATMKGEVGAGFYAAVKGPLPFAFGKVPPELVAVCALEPPPQNKAGNTRDERNRLMPLGNK